MNEQCGAVQKLWLFASKTGTARLFKSKIPRARPSFEPASPLRSPSLKSVHAWPAPQKRVRAPCLSRGVTPQLILAFRCNVSRRGPPCSESFVCDSDKAL